MIHDAFDKQTAINMSIENGVLNGADLSFDVAMMKTPTISADSNHYNFMVGFGDSIIIPSNINASTEEMRNTIINNAKTFISNYLGE